MLDEQTDLLLSRGLDADLDRSEMRQLYRLAASDAAVPKAMGALAGLENAIQALSAATAEAKPKCGAEALTQAIFQDQPATETMPTDQGRALGSRLWQWFRAPDGLSVQPASFAAGLAICLLAVVALRPDAVPIAEGPNPVIEAREEPRLSVTDFQFASAQTRLDWTYQFIVNPGASTRLAMDAGDDRPVRFQLESADRADLSLIHRPPDGGPERVQRLSVDGITFATLRNPKPGDAVIIRNDGEVPVLVYAFTHRADTSRFDTGDAL